MQKFSRFLRIFSELEKNYFANQENFFIHENKILNMIDMAFRKDWQWLLVIEFGIGIVIGIQTLSFTQYKLPSLLKQ